MRLAAARSNPRTASTVDSVRSAASAWVSPSERRALTTSVLTSDRTARLRVARRAPARACFFAEAVRLATRYYRRARAGRTSRKAESHHEFRIIGADGIRACWAAPQGASRRLHRTDRRPDRRRGDRGRRQRLVWGGAARR